MNLLLQRSLISNCNNELQMRKVAEAQKLEI